MKKLLGAILLTLLTFIGCKKDDGGTGPAPTLNAPSNITATRIGSKAVQLSWTDNSEIEDSFWIERRANNGTFLPRLFTVRNVTVAVDSIGLAIDTVYQYRVFALLGTEVSPYSDTATVVLTLPYPRVN